MHYKIQWNLSIPDTIGTAQSVLIKGVLISEVGLYRNVVVRTLESVLIIEVSLFQSVLIREVSLFQSVPIREASTSVLMLEKYLETNLESICVRLGVWPSSRHATCPLVNSQTVLHTVPHLPP